MNKTVTFESHPHQAFSCPTIHPCKHDVAMLKMINMVGEIDVKMYMVVFLKLIQAMVPNMEYDFTDSF